ncbi:MAG: hypothetical protein HOW73_29435 [Polyangiaceae bacterium]|nr:hypothetical protein [Polyangiaceae bacterium]
MFDTVSVPDVIILEKLEDSIRFTCAGRLYTVPHEYLFDEVEALQVGVTCELEIFRSWVNQNDVPHVR